MKRISDFVSKYIAEMMLLFLTIYFLMAFVPPVAFELGFDSVGETVQEVYHFMCHQRVERSFFLFGEAGGINVYSIEELQYVGTIPEVNPYVPAFFSETIFGHHYYGDDIVGYKTALCVRDLALYFGMILTGSILLAFMKYKNITMKVPWKIALFLMIPMGVDVFIQVTGQLLNWSFVTDGYVNSISKRIVTGIMFGIGFGIIVFPILKDSLKDAPKE